ncbi:MAG: hypothetical protein M1836_007083 [Candelina mexicana]|nr:MAG: hypothetical protein M1836_007083 [Candelina mexicana]
MFHKHRKTVYQYQHYEQPALKASWNAPEQNTGNDLGLSDEKNLQSSAEAAPQPAEASILVEHHAENSPKAHCKSVTLNDFSSEACCDSAAIELFFCFSEDCSPIATFNNFEASLSEVYTKIYALLALVQGREASPRAPDAFEQDTSSEEGLLDEKNSTSNGIPCGGVLSDSSSAVCSVNDDVEKPFLLEAPEVLVLPGTMIIETPSIAEKLSLLEATEDLESPGTASQLAVTEALALPGLIYEHDHCADRCI